MLPPTSLFPLRYRGVRYVRDLTTLSVLSKPVSPQQPFKQSQSWGSLDWIPSLNAGWHAGQHIRLRILSTAMGLLGMTEAYPTVRNNADEGLVLMCKKTGNCTRKLYEMALEPENGEQGEKCKRRMKVMVEGPCGMSSHCMVTNYNQVRINRRCR